MKLICCALRFSAAAILLLSSACSVFSPGPSAPGQPGPSATGVASGGGLPTATALAQATPAASCPLPSPDQSVYNGSGPGYCFLYPAEFYFHPATALILLGPSHGAGVESQNASLIVTSENLNGQSLEAYVDQMAAQIGESGDITRQSTTLGMNNTPAIQVDGKQAQLNWRDLLVEHNGWVYQISFQPWDAALPEVRDDVQRLYASVVDSWVFLK